MRKTILTTAAIAFIALGAAFGVMKSEDIKALFASKEMYQKQEQTAEATTEEPATDTTVTTEAAATTATETTQEDTAQEDTALNGETPAAGTEEAAATPAATEDTLKDAAAASAEADIASAVEETAAAPAEAKTEEAKGPFVVDVARALKDRELGAKNAPVTVYDFSSLTCPHCAFFHTEIFPKVKANYIDTGKVRWIFRGFPLNEPALKAEMVARCAPEDQYTKLIDLMFKNQDRWAFVGDPIPNLNMLVRLAGVNDDMFQTCINNKDLEMGLAQAAQAAGEKYKIAATPTFVLNDGVKTFSGAGSYEGFALDIDQTLKALSTPAMSTSNKLGADEPVGTNPLAPKK